MLNAPLPHPGAPSPLLAARNPNAAAVLAQAAEIAAKREARLAANPKPPKGAAGQKRKLKPMRGPDGLVSGVRQAGQRRGCLAGTRQSPSGSCDTAMPIQALDKAVCAALFCVCLQIIEGEWEYEEGEEEGAETLTAGRSSRQRSRKHFGEHRGGLAAPAAAPAAATLTAFVC